MCHVLHCVHTTLARVRHGYPGARQHSWGRALDTDGSGVLERDEVEAVLRASVAHGFWEDEILTLVQPCP